jgi:hypothetical protein
MKIQGKSFRLALNQNEADASTTINGSRLLIPKGNGVSIPCALFAGDPSKADFFIDDLSNINHAVLEIRKKDAAGVRMLDPIFITPEAFTPGLTFAQWVARTGAHFTFVLTSEQTSWDIIDGWDGSLHFAFGLNTNDYGDVTVARATGKVFEDGVGEPAVPPEITGPTYKTHAQNLAIFLELADLNSLPGLTIPGKVRLTTANGLELWNATESAWVPVTISGTGDGRQLTF